MKKIYSFLFLMLCASTGFSQLGNWKYIRPSNTGLGGDYYLCIRVDKCGDKWTGGFLPFWSEGSLTRFDGEKFTNWSNFEGFLPADRVYDIAFDSQNEIWVATNGVGNGVAHGGIVHYDGTEWTTYNSTNTPLPADDIRGIAVDLQDRIWATFWNTSEGIGGVCRFDGSNWTIYLPGTSGLPSYTVDKIVADNQDNIWVGTDFGLAKFDGNTWTNYDENNSGLMGHVIRDVEYDPETERLYVVTGNAINILENGQWTYLTHENAPISSTGLWAIDAKDGKMIITTVGGTYLTYVFDGTNWINHPEIDHTYDARIDNEGNFWTAGNGAVMKYDGNNWTTYNSKNTGLTGMFNDDLFIDSTNKVWFASNDNGGINRFDCPTWQDYNPYNAGLWPSPIDYTGSGRGIAEDSLGDIWMVYSGAPGGVIQVPDGNVDNPENWVVWDNSNSGVSLQFLKRAAGDLTGNLWVGYEGACSVSRYSHDTNSWTNFNLFQLGQTTCGAGSGIKSIRVDIDNNVWICGLAGLAKFDQTNWTFYSELNTPMQQGFVMDIAFDTADNKWIATEHGLFRFDGTNWTEFNMSNSGFFGDFITAVVVGNDGTIWVANHNPDIFPEVGGISSYNGSTWTHYSPSNSGLQEKYIDRMDVDQQGNLWLMSATHGAAIFNPSGISGYDCLDNHLELCDVLSVEEVETQSSLPKLTGYPNPAFNELNLEFDSDESKNAKILIRDISGKIVWEKDRPIEKGKNQIKIDISSLETGVYLCQIDSDFQVLKFIKRK